jgi:endonuclease YncB( thermonuclease family)
VLKNNLKLLICTISVSLVFGLALHAETIQGRVVAIQDGDTLEVLQNKTPIRIRLAHIDCPEKRQAYGKKAKYYLSDLLFKKDIRVEVLNKDRYNRKIGVVFLEDQNINHLMVKKGLAWWYQKYSNDAIYKKLENEARKLKIGLWSQKHPIPPWEFRKRKRSRKKLAN